MRSVELSPGIFKNFPEVKVCFAIGRFGFGLNGKLVAVNERKQFLKSMGCEPGSLITLQQVHGTKVIKASESAANFLEPEKNAADGLYEQRENLFLGIWTADCLPILFYQKTAGIVGIIHAGWRGTRAGILPHTLMSLIKTYKCSVREFYFYLGPAAQECCYEGIHRDFVEVNLNQLKTLGVPVSHIENSGICTIHNFGYPSHRRDGEARKETLLSLIGKY